MSDALIWGSDDPDGIDDRAYGLFQVLTSTHMPPGKAFMFSADPARPDQPVTVMVDEAAQLVGSPGGGKARFDWSELVRQGRKTGVFFPGLEEWKNHYLKINNVPQNTDNNPREKYTMDMSGIARMREDLEKMLTTFAGMVAVVERFGGEPGDGTVIKFEHTFEADFVRNEDAKVYDYVAVRKFGKWYVSGRPFSGKAVKWAELLEFIGDGRAWICSEFTEVPVPGAAPSDDDEALKSAVADLLAASGGEDTSKVAEKLLALVRESK